LTPVRKRVGLIVSIVAVAGIVVLLNLQLRNADLTLRFTREELQGRVAEKFPLDQKILLLFTVTYSNPVIKLEDGSDRIGVGLDVSAKLAGNKFVKGRVEGDWQVRYDSTDGGLYFDDPKVSKFRIEGLPPSTEDTVTQVATPLIREYLSRVPVYRLKPGELRQDIARGVLKSVSVKQGMLVVVVGPG
jgi:Protein of unknown function (DUF1439)